MIAFVVEFSHNEVVYIVVFAFAFYFIAFLSHTFHTLRCLSSGVSVMDGGCFIYYVLFYILYFIMFVQ